jgi:hypothetical protein
MLEDAEERGLGHSGPDGGSRAFCDRMNSWAQGEGQPGLGYIFWREGDKGRRGAGRQEHRRGAHGAPSASSLGLGMATPPSSSLGDPKKFVQVRGRGAHPVGEELNLTTGPLRAVLDRRLPVLRVERGREEGRLRAQPVLDAAGRLEALNSARTR